MRQPVRGLRMCPPRTGFRRQRAPRPRGRRRPCRGQLRGERDPELDRVVRRRQLPPLRTSGGQPLIDAIDPRNSFRQPGWLRPVSGPLEAPWLCDPTSRQVCFSRLLQRRTRRAFHRLGNGPVTAVRPGHHSVVPGPGRSGPPAPRRAALPVDDLTIYGSYRMAAVARRCDHSRRGDRSGTTGDPGVEFVGLLRGGRQRTAARRRAHVRRGVEGCVGVGCIRMNGFGRRAGSALIVSRPSIEIATECAAADGVAFAAEGTQGGQR